MDKNGMKALLEKNTNMQELLFPRGYLLTDNKEINSSVYPFYDAWNILELREYKFFIHPKQRYCCFSGKQASMVLIGHTFNPLISEKNVFEEDLLKKAVDLYEKEENAFHSFLNQWTGLFNLFVFEDDSLRIYGDAAAMYMTFYGTHNGKQYVSSHTNLLGDVCDVKFDEYISELINYRFYSLFGKTLPGDLSPYAQFKRLLPNHYANLENGAWMPKRFFPTDDNALLDSQYDELIDQSSQILSNSMKIIHQKWNKPAVSLTGGCDSKTTLSCTREAYDKYSYFSYTSSESEKVDAEAASKICSMLNLPHKIYEISNNDADYVNIDTLRYIMEYNSGSIGKSNANDVRKRAFFINNDDFDVEVKSWVSEIARSYYHKRFNKIKFPKKLTPRYATSLYKIFITNRRLVRKTDKVFKDFIDKYYSDGSFNKIPWYDLFFWEFRIGSWNGLVITGEQQIAFDIEIPYNNRILLQYLLSTPVEKRIKDEPHWDIMRKMNPQIADCGISVVNVKHTKKRAKLERLYLEIASKIPF